jgi:hypothetical protein
MLSVVRCYSFATDYGPLTTDKCYSHPSLRDDLPAVQDFRLRESAEASAEELGRRVASRSLRSALGRQPFGSERSSHVERAEILESRPRDPASRKTSKSSA